MNAEKELERARADLDKERKRCDTLLKTLEREQKSNDTLRAGIKKFTKKANQELGSWQQALEREQSNSRDLLNQIMALGVQVKAPDRAAESALETEVKKLRVWVVDLDMLNKRLRLALAQYADHNNWGSPYRNVYKGNIGGEEVLSPWAEAEEALEPNKESEDAN